MTVPSSGWSNWILCRKVAFPSNQDKSISKIGSKAVTVLLSSVFPSNSKPVSNPSKINSVGKGPSLGRFCEYKCHLGWTDALKISKYSVSLIFSRSVVQTTGSCDWSPSVQKNIRKKPFLIIVAN